MRSLTLSLLSPALVLAGCAHNQPMAQPQTSPSAVATDRQTEDPSESGPHYARARELYALGPSKAAEIIAELDLELRDHPENVQALLLKATTQMGIEQFDAALATLDQLSTVASKTETIYPSAVFLRARIHLYKGEPEKAKQTLEPFWAFFQSDEESRSQYESLMAAIEAKLPEPSDK